MVAAATAGADVLSGGSSGAHARRLLRKRVRSNFCRRWPAVCRVLQLCLYAKCESFSRIHQAVPPRRCVMYRRGGVYLDFKCGLLQPLWSWLLELQNAACSMNWAARAKPGSSIHGDILGHVQSQIRVSGLDHLLPATPAAGSGAGRGHDDSAI